MRVLLTGASGKLGCYLLRQLASRHTVRAWTGVETGRLFGCELQPVDLNSAESVESAFRELPVDVILHCAAMTAVADCFRNPDAAWRVNVDATRQLAKLAEDAGVPFVLISTDMVFDGERGHYREVDAPRPLSVYGKTKVAAEQAVLTSSWHAVVRVSWMYGIALHKRQSFFDMMLSELADGHRISLFEDEWRSPLSLRTAARELARFLETPRSGLYHLGGPERLSRFEMGVRLAHSLGVDPQLVTPAHRAEVAFDEPRPADLSLDSTHWRSTFPESQFVSWDEEVERILKDWKGRADGDHAR